MITCKECLKNADCTNINKKYEVDADGDSFANWCDDFIGCEPHYVIENGVKVLQVSNLHIWVGDYQTGRVMCHMQCTAYKTDDELREIARRFRED